MGKAARVLPAILVKNFGAVVFSATNRSRACGLPRAATVSTGKIGLSESGER